MTGRLSSYLAIRSGYGMFDGVPSIWSTSRFRVRLVVGSKIFLYKMVATAAGFTATSSLLAG